MKFTELEKRTLHLFSLLSNSTRYMIIKSLKNGDLNVGTLVKITNKTYTTVSKHLRLLKDMDVVSFRTIENEVYYSLKKKDVIEVIAKGMECVNRGHK